MRVRKQRPMRFRWLTATTPAVMMLLAGVVVAEAQPRANSTRMSCAAARQFVTRQGAVLLDTSPTTFNRYVVSRAFCTSTEITEPAFVRTADGRQCFVGYTCREPLGNFVR